MPSRCSGGTTAGKDGGGYCKEGYMGPLCGVCADDGRYLAESGQCLQCPPIVERLALMLALVLTCLVLFGGAASLYRSRLDWCVLRLLRLLVAYLQQLEIMVKLKIIVGFMQVAVSLNSIYDARLPRSYTIWVDDAFRWMQFDFAPVLIPSVCFGSGYQITLMLTAFAPIAVIGIAATYLIGKHLCQARCSRWRAVVDGLVDSAPVALVVSFYCVTSVSQAIFDAFLCIAYDDDSARGLTRSFLRVDLSVSCDGSRAHEQLKSLAYVFVVIWPVRSL